MGLVLWCNVTFCVSPTDRVALELEEQEGIAESQALWYGIPIMQHSYLPLTLCHIGLVYFMTMLSRLKGVY